MNRLQKKCLIATAGIHLMLLIAICCSGFVSSEPKPDKTQILDVIPANVIDAAFNSGVKNATPPAPQPIVQPQPQPQPQPVQPAPKPVEPTPSILKRIEDAITPKPKPEPVKSAPPKQTQTQEHIVKPNLTPINRTAPKSIPNPTLKNSIANLKNKLSKGTTIEAPGDSSVAYASYDSVVKSIYDAAWILPNTIAADENITVKVTIASDGTVISARIVTPSGDAPADTSVQKALDRVKFVREFPEGTTDKQRTYTIVFNPQVKNSEE